MSAYIVDEDHINIIVSYMTSPVTGEGMWTELEAGYNYLTPDNAAEIAKVLYKENVRSVNNRYNDNTPDDYEFNYIPGTSSQYRPTQISGAIDCLEYQSCETDDYHETRAYKLLGQMRKHLLKKIAAEAGDENAWSL